MCFYLPTEAKTLVEIGSYAGESTEVFLLALPNTKVIGVDPLIPYDSPGAESVYDWQKNLDALKLLEEQHKGRFELWQMTSERAASRISEPVDIVYIDGAHDYKSVKEDIEFWQPLLSENGILCGHDFSLADVNRALTETLPEEEFIVFADDSWILS